MQGDVQFHTSEFVNILKEAVDGFHELTKDREGYEPVEGTGDDLQLIMTLNRTKDGGVRLRFMSVRDWLTTISPGQLMGPQHLEDFSNPTLPHTSVTMNPESE